ncbi:MAG: HD-GYP domain-containing protein [Marinobacter sp.]|uniref:HD-GYP domain-containing protein n=1 Tax=Marinobacter sp. TaxID=50741 RepID=UPI0029C4C625|nr:HD-GYP domain-containing protein [Marinobacter sp.]MDX5334838.1 HD-GYP domain-containing protein [Marinobacter sp.]MDX5385474.1 HD-GYP domain-containing protein [Marinobacter sp.]MDX5440974.1 HD-GYP domain-containing protein [Alteromonadaceae bacterium]MDX5471106.1 HD-GYP domain-containing protein [Marinobacter sp.]
MIKRIPIAALKVGMYISDLNNDWIPHNTQRKKGMIKREETIEKIRRMGVQYVYIDVEKGLDSQDAETAQEVDRRNEQALQNAGEQRPGIQHKVALTEEIVIAQRIHSQAQGLVGSFMNNVKMGAAIDIAPIHQLADELQNSVLRNANALSCLGRIREKDNYLLEHSVNLSVLMSLFGNYRNLPADVLHQTVVGALLHDLGKILTPDDILHKPGRLTAEEFEVMKLHARHSRDILASTEGIGEIAVITAAQHHEKLDGSGYPEGLKGEEITEYGRMVAITDAYDAITSDRVYHKGMTPSQGLKKLLEWSGDHLDPELVKQFIRCIGLYPVGSLVLLESGRLGVVVETNDQDQRLPVVRVMYHTRFRLPITVETIDLSRAGNQDRIIRAVDPEDYKLDVRKFLA